MNKILANENQSDINIYNFYDQYKFITKMHG